MPSEQEVAVPPDVSNPQLHCVWSLRVVQLTWLQTQLPLEGQWGSAQHVAEPPSVPSHVVVFPWLASLHAQSGFPLSLPVSQLTWVALDPLDEDEPQAMTRAHTVSQLHFTLTTPSRA